MKNKLGIYLEGLSITLLGLFLFAFPLIFTSLTTDSFALPKEFLLAGVVLVSFLVYGLKSLSNKVVVFRRTPFDLAILIFLLVSLLSSLLAQNKPESITAAASLIFSGLLYYVITNTVKTKRTVNILIASFITGGVFTSLLGILSFFKLYILPSSLAKSQIFTPLGTLTDQAIYLAVCLVLALYLVYQWKKNNKTKLLNANLGRTGLITATVLGVASLLLGLGITIYALIKLQNPVILPFATGFQIAFASISQDTGRALLSFLFGSGFGTFEVDFARFKQTLFNQTPYWNLTFFRSSSFVLELMATTGVLGLLAFLNIVYKALKQKPLSLPLVFLLVVSFVLPLSPVLQILIFIVLGIDSTLRALGNKEYFDVELGLVTLKSGFVAVTADENKEVKHGLSRILPLFVFILIILFVGVSGFYTSLYAASNVIFQRSLVAASQNNGSNAYQQQAQALNLVGYNDAYQRIFSQTNLALANSLSSSTKGQASPSAQTQQTVYTLIQQSINSGRMATTLAPQSAVNWQNLTSIYRSLIGFGKNADSFAVLAAQQAELLDSTNPQEYINFGGLYFQLKLWDKAEEQFKLAINLKPDFANAYYNLAHTLQEKGDLESALAQLEQVKILVKNDPANLSKVNAEIDALKAGIKSNTAPLAPNTALPVQNPPVVIPAPSTPKPSPTPTPTQTPLASPVPTATPAQ